MSYFFETTGTIKSGVGFSHFEPCHLLWLLFFAVSTTVCCIVYRKLGQTGRRRMRWVFVSLILIDEGWKWFGLLYSGNATLNYLPLHLCSINIFIILIHAIKSTDTLGNFLYLTCIPGALFALLFPTWTKLPFLNFMHLHSFTVHTLLALYPIMLTVGGDIKPRLRQIPRCLVLLVTMATLVYGFNYHFDTNFMFLMEASKGNPLYWFGENWGSHLLGFPVLLVAVIAVMYTPVVIAAQIRRRKEKNAPPIANKQPETVES